MKGTDKQRLFSVTQIAEMFGVTSRAVQRWVKAGHFPDARKGPGKNSPFRIPEDNVRAFISKRAEELGLQWDEEQLLEVKVEQDVDHYDQLRRPGRQPIVVAMAELLQKTGQEQSKGRLALIVEDDADAGDIFKFTLETVGFSPVVVGLGNEALSLMKSMVPDVLVLDLHLPDMPGMEVLRHVRADPELAKIPVIVATAHPQLAKSVRDEADLVLIKPVRFNVLQDKAVELAREL